MRQDYLSSNGIRSALTAKGPEESIAFDSSVVAPFEDFATDGSGSFNAGEYWHMLMERKGTLLAFAALGALCGFLLARAQPSVFRAYSLIQIENLNEDFLNTRNVNPTAHSEPFQPPEYTVRTQMMVLQSRPVLERAIAKDDLQTRLLAGAPIQIGFLQRVLQRSSQDYTPPPQERALAIAADGLKVRPEPNTRVLSVTFDSSDPEIAADFVNAVGEAFEEQSRDSRSQDSLNTSKWLTQQLEDVKLKLERDEDALQRYATESNLTFTSRNDNTADDRLRQLQAELLKAETELGAKQSAYELASAAPAESLPQVLDDPTLKEYQIQLTTLRRQLAELWPTFAPENPKIVNVQAQIAALESALGNKRANILARIHNEYETASRRVKLLDASYSSQLGVLAKQSTKVAHYSVLQRDVDTSRQLYAAMIQRVKEAGLASAMQASEVQVIESAVPPRLPSGPSIPVDTELGLLSGLLVGGAFTFWRGRSYRGIRNPGHVSLKLKVPELGIIPAYTGSTRLRGLLEEPGQHKLQEWERWPPAMAESFRFALTSILLSRKENPRPRVIVLTSAAPREGKTTVISNLGIALARTGRRVLLIDGDLRRPRLHDIFAVDNATGFSGFLEGSPGVDIQATAIPNLSLLPSGKTSDEGLFFARQVGHLFRRLKSEYDTILVDSPPLLQMSDARLLAHFADAVILVVAQHTDRDAVLLARQRLAEDGSNLLGTILNNWNPKSSPRAYQYYTSKHLAKK